MKQGLLVLPLKRPHSAVFFLYSETPQDIKQISYSASILSVSKKGKILKIIILKNRPKVTLDWLRGCQSKVR